MGKTIKTLILMMPLLICSCSQDATKKTTAKKKSTVEVVVESMTGHTAIKSGNEAADKIKSISISKQQELDEVLRK